MPGFKAMGLQTGKFLIRLATLSEKYLIYQLVNQY